MSPGPVPPHGSPSSRLLFRRFSWPVMDLFLASVCESPTFILPAPGCWSTTQQRFYFSSCTFQFSKLVFLIFLLAYWSKPKFCYNNNKKTNYAADLPVITPLAPAAE